MNLNKCLIGGHLCRDPETRFTGKGTAVGSFSIAVNRKWGGEGQEREEVAFIECTAWAKTAETIQQHFKKGSPILVEGRLKTDSWDDKQSGQKKSKLILVVEQFHFVGGGERQQQAAPAAKTAEKPADDTDMEVPF
jgi:single-strand DNA-binding protein